ncbi:hypothetical protein [Bosea sp. LC85]|uniref:hypothetical protein n=1 Tax=Bosea sp. LC85 TaxID=1502851 RepID=UPI0009E02C0A|nr:hypothetical protein [Bosea sp. LC85]
MSIESASRSYALSRSSTGRFSILRREVILPAPRRDFAHKRQGIVSDRTSRSASTGRLPSRHRASPMKQPALLIGIFVEDDFPALAVGGLLLAGCVAARMVNTLEAHSG